MNKYILFTDVVFFVVDFFTRGQARFRPSDGQSGVQVEGSEEFFAKVDLD